MLDALSIFGLLSQFIDGRFHGDMPEHVQRAANVIN